MSGAWIWEANEFSSVTFSVGNDRFDAHSIVIVDVRQDELDSAGYGARTIFWTVCTCQLIGS